MLETEASGEQRAEGVRRDRVRSHRDDQLDGPLDCERPRRCRPEAHDLTATATDAAGSTSAVSLPLDPVIGEAALTSVVSPLTSLRIRRVILSRSTLPLTRTATKVYDGTTSLGTASTAADGTWSFKTSSAVSNTVRTFTATRWIVPATSLRVRPARLSARQAAIR